MSALPVQEEPFDFEGYSAYLEAEIVRLRREVVDLQVRLVGYETDVDQLERTTSHMALAMLGAAAAVDENDDEVDTPLPFEVH